MDLATFSFHVPNQDAGACALSEIGEAALTNQITMAAAKPRPPDEALTQGRIAPNDGMGQFYNLDRRATHPPSGAEALLRK
jgi:hypothetical protein